MIAAIVAVDNNWGIGYDNHLLARISTDLKYFKAITEHNVVIMGRKTWDSLPIKPLPNRTNIVITNQKHGDFNGAKFMTLKEAQKYAITNRPTNVYIIGGASIYKEFLPLCERVYVTKIDKSYSNVDAYFPNLDKMKNWAPGACSPIYTDGDLNYQFWQYECF